MNERKLLPKPCVHRYCQNIMYLEPHRFFQVDICEECQRKMYAKDAIKEMKK